MIYLQALTQTLTSMGPQYITNIYTWVKCAVWDAPFRVYLDIELEKISIERHLSHAEKEENQINDDSRDSA